MKTASPLLLPLLRSRSQGEIMARLFLDPDTQPSLSEIAEEVGASVAQVLREVNRLEAAGLVTSQRRGNSRIVTVLTDTPMYRPMAEILALSFGPVPVLERLLADVDGIEEAFIYGSWAARYHEQPGSVPGDIDVLVIGDADRDTLYDIAEEAGRTLGREVNIRRQTRESWESEKNAPFRRTVEQRPIVPLRLKEDAHA